MKKDFNFVSVKKNPCDIVFCDINEKIDVNDYKDQCRRIVDFVIKNAVVPNYVATSNSKINVCVDLIIYALSKILVFYYENNRLPSFCLYDSSVLNKTDKDKVKDKYKDVGNGGGCVNPYKSSPHPTRKGCDAMGQNTGYFCGVCALQHSLFKFGINVGQSQLAKWAGTTSSGTSHSGIRTAVAMVNKKYNVNISVDEKSFSDLGIVGLVKLICKDNVDVIVHLLYRDRWGHYESINEINTKTGVFKILNSLGDKCNSGCFCGYVEYRSLDVEKRYIDGISQKSIIVLTKN